MTRIATFLAAFALAALYGQIAVAEGGGREWSMPFKFEYSDKVEPEAEDDAVDYSWLARGSRGGFGYLGVRLSNDLYFQVELSTAHVLDDGGSAGGSSASTDDEVAFGSAFAYKGNVYFTPRFEGFHAGVTFDSTRPVQIVEEIEDHDDWSVELGAGYEINPLTHQLRATYQAAEDEGERLGGVFYDNNRFRFQAGLTFAAIDDQPAAKTEPEPEPEPQLGTGFRGLFQRGFAGEYGHVAVRLSKYQDFRVELSTAYVLGDDGDDGGSVGLKDPFRAIAGLFSGKKDEPEAVRFGGAYVHLNNLYVIPDSLSGFGFRLDPERDIEIVEDYQDQDDWGVRFRVGYKFNELTDVQMDAYQEATEKGRHFGDVYYDDNRFTILGGADFIYQF